MPTLNAQFKTDSWDEQPIKPDEDGTKMSQTHVVKTYTGDIEGTATHEYVMVYPEGGPASFAGMERIMGKLNGKSGSFVVQHVGKFENGVVKAEMTIVPDSGTGELKGISGHGTFESGHAESYPFVLEYEL